MERPDPLTDRHEDDTVEVQQSSEDPGSFRVCRRYGGVSLLFSTAVPSLSVAENRSKVRTDSK